MKYWKISNACWLIRVLLLHTRDNFFLDLSTTVRTTAAKKNLEWEEKKERKKEKTNTTTK